MSRNTGSFRPGELDGPDTSFNDGELAEAYAAARELEAALPFDPPAPAREFADRVMAAVAAEPTPRAAGFLAGLLRRPGLRSFVLSVRQAWTVASSGAGRPARARGLALAYVLAIMVIGISLTGAAAYGTAGALGLLDGGRSPSPSITEPSSSPDPDATAPDESGEPSGSPEPSESAEPSSSAEPSQSGEPGDTLAPPSSDDHGGSSPVPTSPTDNGGFPTPSPSGSDDSGGSSGSPLPSE